MYDQRHGSGVRLQSSDSPLEIGDKGVKRIIIEAVGGIVERISNLRRGGGLQSRL